MNREMRKTQARTALRIQPHPRRTHLSCRYRCCCASRKAPETHLELRRHIAQSEERCSHPYSKGRKIRDSDLEQGVLRNITDVLSDKKESKEKKTLQDTFGPLLLNVSITPMHNHFLDTANATLGLAHELCLTSSSFQC